MGAERAQTPTEPQIGAATPLTPVAVHGVFGAVLLGTVVVTSVVRLEPLWRRLLRGFNVRRIFCRFGGQFHRQRGRGSSQQQQPPEKTASSPASSSSSKTSKAPRAHRQFQVLYVTVYLIMVAGDWLQGPYMYALYDAYGFSHDEIAALFVAGFASSMVFGTFVGSLADGFGRKRGALLYVVTYALSCATKHWNSYWVLLLGRLLGGVATSLLCSVFDAWLVAEHARRNLDPARLSTIFANAQAGNSIVAIVAGVVGESSARASPLRRASMERESPLIEKNDGDIFVGGYCAPFDVAAIVLLVGGIIVAAVWPENYGHNKQRQLDGAFNGLRAGVRIVAKDPRILLVGAVSACFEAAMYSFIFLWTPAVKATPTDCPPFGEIFSIMMLAAMIGSRVYVTYPTVALHFVFFFAALVFIVPALKAGADPFACLLAFVLFEIVVGIYFPAVNTLKSQLIPDAQRSTIYNLFRVPLNVIVLIVLLSRASAHLVFVFGVILLLLAAFAQQALNRRLKELSSIPQHSESSSESTSEQMPRRHRHHHAVLHAAAATAAQDDEEDGSLPLLGGDHTENLDNVSDDANDMTDAAAGVVVGVGGGTSIAVVVETSSSSQHHSAAGTSASSSGGVPSSSSPRGSSSPGGSPIVSAV